MFLFVRQIPKTARRSDLVKFIDGATRGFWHSLSFVKKPAIEKCEVLCIQDIEKETVEYHGLISIQPEKGGLKIIDKLNGTPFLGTPVLVRQYHRRSPYKDRRRTHADLEQLPEERRQRHRRRSRLRIRTLPTGQVRVR